MHYFPIDERWSQLDDNATFSLHYHASFVAFYQEIIHYNLNPLQLNTTFKYYNKCECSRTRVSIYCRAQSIRLALLDALSSSSEVP